jgi:hypothetical protein
MAEDEDGAAEAPNDQRQQVLAVELIESGSELAGAATGAAIGLIGGPGGAVGGAIAGVALTRVLKRVGADLRQRLLGPREEIRLGAAAAFAGATIRQLLEEGHAPRDDGFFEATDEDRPAAEEVLEGVLLKARDAHEERKVRLLGVLYAQIAFHPEISTAHANHLVELASRLTYRQLVLLAVADDEVNRPRLRPTSYRGDADAVQRIGIEGQALLTETYDLYQQGLINGGGEAWISLTDVTPQAMRVQGSGAVLARLMALETIPAADRKRVYDVFSPDGAGSAQSL